jgi:hypothetical protein
MRRGRPAIPGHLAGYLDALNIAAGDWTGIDALTERILGPALEKVRDRRPSSLYGAVIRLLVWSGLLLEADDCAVDTRVMNSPL